MIVKFDFYVDCRFSDFPFTPWCEIRKSVTGLLTEGKMQGLIELLPTWQSGATAKRVLWKHRAKDGVAGPFLPALKAAIQ